MISLIVGWILFSGGGLYGGTQLMLGLVLGVQDLALFCAVILPILIRMIRRKPTPSRSVWVLVMSAVLLASVVTVAVFFIPTGSSC
ncbi:MAG: hypothetical protein QM755_14210 [Luteolibacter sp.]